MPSLTIRSIQAASFILKVKRKQIAVISDTELILVGGLPTDLVKVGNVINESSEEFTISYTNGIKSSCYMRQDKRHLRIYK